VTDKKKLSFKTPRIPIGSQSWIRSPAKSESLGSHRI